MIAQTIADALNPPWQTTTPAYYGFLAKLVACLEPRIVLELGTGAGHSAAFMMEGLPDDAILATINWPNPPSGDDVGAALAHWRKDERLWEIRGDTSDPAIRHQFWNRIADHSVDLLFIDSGTEHTYDLIAAEWALWASALADHAVVCLDDLDFPGGGIRRFWDALPFDKIELKISPFGFGVFQFERVKP